MIDGEVENVYLLQRMLILTPQQGKASLKIKCKFHYEPHSQTINFGISLHRLFRFHPQVRQIIQDTQLFYLDQRHRTKHFLGDFPLKDCQIFYDDWSGSSIMIFYRKHQPPSKDIQPKSQSKKSRERTIKQVRTQIERWRQVVNQQNNLGGPKGITLIAAARSIGISKKSIDDYLRLIKMGNKLNFDFDHFEGEKIGYLRGFIRSRLKQPSDESKMLSEIDSYWDSTYISKQG